MIIKNGNVLNDDFRFMIADVKVKGDKISDIGENLCGDDVIEADGCYVVPGFIDTHMHGALANTFIDYTDDTARIISEYEAKNGTTSLVPAISAAKREKLEKVCDHMNKCMGFSNDKCARIHGFHLEGPFFSLKYKGAHLPENIRVPSVDELSAYVGISGKNIKIITIAPELDGAEETIKYAVKNGICVSVGHTDATYEDVVNAEKWGASQATHLFNAMSALNHRAPNAVGGALGSEAIKCELICDFFHVHPTVVKLAYKIKGRDKINMITDSEIGTGLPDGEYDVNGRKIIVKNNQTRCEDGTIAGGTTCLIDGVRNLVSIGIPFEDACMMASKNPALTAKIYDKTGSITVGKTADILILDKELKLKHVILRGKIL